MKIKKVNIFSSLLILILSVSCSIGSNQDLDSFSRMVIPEGAYIVSAELFIYGGTDNTEVIEVDVYRVNSPWVDTTVTWNTHNNAYDPEILSTRTIINGWQSFNIKTYLDKWISGEYSENYGLMLDLKNSSGLVWYASKEFSDTLFRPYIQVTYLINGNLITDDAEVIIADAYIWEAIPDTSGIGDSLYTGYFDGFEKKTLIQIDLEMDEGDLVGTGTPGYWKNHPWPVQNIEIGGIMYDRDGVGIYGAIEQMLIPVKKDKWYTMFRALVAAKLNVLNGANDEPIADIIAAADEWMAINHHWDGNDLVIIRAKSEAWKVGEEYYKLLDDYNNGLLEGAPSRDTLE